MIAPTAGSSKLLSKETVSAFLQVPAKNLYRSRQKFIIFGTDIAARRDLNASAKMTLMAMAIEARGTGLVSASDQALGQLVGLSRPTVVAAKVKLLEAKLIKENGDVVQQIQPYKILHPIFLAANAQPEDGPPTDLRRRKPWKMCEKCFKLRPVLPKDGICKTCKGVKRTEGIAERVARRVVREEAQKAS